MRQHRPGIPLSPHATKQDGELALSEMFCTMQHLNSGVVSGEFFETEEMAHAWYTSLYRDASCMVVSPEGKELKYWGRRHGCDTEMRQWWCFHTGQIDAADDLDTCCLDRSEVLMRSKQALVVANIYDVAHDVGLKRLNRAVRSFGSGVYHAAIEVHGREFSFGGFPDDFKGDWDASGVFECASRECEEHDYRESVILGRTSMSPEQVDKLKASLSKIYSGNAYDLVGNNCCHFSSDFAQRLGARDLPKWITQLARTGKKVVNVIHDGMEFRSAPLNDKYHFGDFTRGVIQRITRRQTTSTIEA